MRYVLEVCRVASWLLYPIMPNKCQELLSALSVTEFEADSLGELNGLTTGVQTKMGAPLFPKMKKLPPDIQVARDKALGIERKPETLPHPKRRKSNSKCSKPFHFRVVSSLL